MSCHSQNSPRSYPRNIWGSVYVLQLIPSEKGPFDKNYHSTLFNEEWDCKQTSNILRIPLKVHVRGRPSGELSAVTTASMEVRLSPKFFLLIVSTPLPSMSFTKCRVALPLYTTLRICEHATRKSIWSIFWRNSFPSMKFTMIPHTQQSD